MATGLIIGRQLLIMFIILALGMLCYAKGIITKEGTKQLSVVELTIVNPMLIFMSYQTEYDSKLVNGLIWAFILSIISYIIGIFLANVVVSKKNPNRPLELISIIYSNCGFMGIPLINGIYGSEGVLYLTAYVTMFNLLVWTHGYITIKGEKDLSSLIKALKNPSVIAVFAGLIFYLTNIRLPSVPSTALRFISDMNTPLAMLIAGATVAQSNMLKALKHIDIYRVCIMKLLVIPFVSFIVMMLFNPPQLVLMVVTIAAACPTATTCTMFAITLDKNPKKCAEFFASTTLLCVLTMPLVTMLCSLFT